MKKEDQFPQNEPSFDDANYQDAMRVDPLTTGEAIAEELRGIQSRREARKKQAEEKERAEAEEQRAKEAEELEELRKLKAERSEAVSS